jgi:DNA-binding transcriptional MerR regulator
MPLYTTSAAAKLAHVSAGTIRNLTTGQFAATYDGLFSPGATPGKGQPRLFTSEDVKLLAYIRQQTAAGVTHEEAARRVRDGELEAFDWFLPVIGESSVPPEEAPEATPAGPQAPRSTEAGSFALAIASQWASLLESARAREVALQDRVIEAETARIRAEAQLEAVQAQLAELKAAQARPWYKRIFGG